MARHPATLWHHYRNNMLGFRTNRVEHATKNKAIHPVCLWGHIWHLKNTCKTKIKCRVHVGPCWGLSVTPFRSKTAQNKANNCQIGIIRPKSKINQFRSARSEQNGLLDNASTTVLVLPWLLSPPEMCSAAGPFPVMGCGQVVGWWGLCKRSAVSSAVLVVKG